MSVICGWTIEGAEGERIIGTTHRPGGDATGVLVIIHGFKGYKDYGMFPCVARTAAGGGFVAHRFNVSHSGMTERTETFERPDLFERDTWNKQVHDLRAVLEAIGTGRLDGRGLPCVLFGHSRGGATALLTVGRHADDPGFAQPAGIVTAAAPSRLNNLTPEQADELLKEGYLLSPSSRTGQPLRIGRAFLAEQQADPAAHDLPARAARIRCPVLLVHGQRDPTVPALCAQELKRAIGDNAEVQIVTGADHVFNTPNPMPADATAPPQLQVLLDALMQFSRRVCAAPARR